VINSTYGVIGGGYGNDIESSGGTIAGGVLNIISGGATHSTIGGGYANQILDNSTYSSIFGGSGNQILENSTYSFIGGGYRNTNSAIKCAISGGALNEILSGADYSAIGGGSGNQIFGSGTYSVISGGSKNTNTAASGTVAGGSLNYVAGTSTGGTIPGGVAASTVSYGQYAYASGCFSAGGDAQGSTFVLRGTTTTSGNFEIFLDGSTERMKVPLNTTWACEILLASRTSTGVSRWIKEVFGVKNVSGTASFIGIPVSVGEGHDSGSTAGGADFGTTGDSIKVIIGTTTAVTTRWVATVHAVEVGF